MPKGPASTPFFPEAMVQSQEVLDSLIRWEERMYLHTDRSDAYPGEYLFFKAYAMTGPKKLRVSPSKVLKVNLTDPDGVLVSSQYYPLVNGKASGAIEIPKGLDPNTYTLQAYTRWMQNYGPQQYFTRQIRVAEAAKPASFQPEGNEVSRVQFYPEGGKLLPGINNKVIIKAWDELGSPAYLQGDILDNTGTRVGDIKNYDRGLGMTILKPQEGISYQLRLQNGLTFDLPKVDESGYGLQVNTLDPERIRITIAAVGMDHGPLILNGKSGEKDFFKEELELDPSGQLQLEIPKKQLPAGILHFTLTGPDGEFLAARPVRVEGPEALQIEVVPMAQELSNGGLNAFRLKVRDSEGNPVQTEISLSVTEESGSDHPGISQYLRPNPGSGNVIQFRKALFLDDLNALSEPSETNQRAYPDEILFPIQNELELIGYVYNLKNELLRETEIQVMSSTEEVLFIQEAKTDESGILKVSGMQFSGEIPLIFRTKGEDTRRSLVRFEPLHEEI